MATPHFRYQLGLHGPQIGRLLGLALALAPGLAQAQHKPGDDIDRSKSGKVKSIRVKNLPDYNERFFRPGFYIAPSFSRFFIEQSASYTTQQTLAASSIISPSFGVGFIGDIRLGPPETHLHLRFAPGVSFLTRSVEFKGYKNAQPDTVLNQEVSTTQLDLPFLIKYQSDRRRNSRVYLIAGLKPSTTISTRLNDPKRNQLRITSSDLSIEYGIGLDLFYPFFKFAPELRFSHGLSNLFVPRTDGYSQSLQSLRTNTVTLYLNFE